MKALLDVARLELEYGDALPLVRNTDLASYLAVLIRVARVDEISVEERNQAVPIAHDLRATMEETVEAMLLADKDQTFAELVERLEHPAVRLCLYRDACRIALADGQVDAHESASLEDLRAALAIDPEVALAVQTDLEQARVCQERFLARVSLVLEVP